LHDTVILLAASELICSSIKTYDRAAEPIRHCDDLLLCLHHAAAFVAGRVRVENAAFVLEEKASFRQAPVN
jgi:hypothetical protein